MLNIIITVDYEIFGNGKGDVKKHILNPTDRLLDISDKFNVPLTIMFEAYEFIAYERYNNEIQNDLGYSPAKLIREQVKNAYDNGHDIQLHVHPQFAEMTYTRKRFNLKNPSASVMDIKEEEVYNLLKIGKEKLESILSFPDYKCIALRLSNMPWIEAPANTLKPMDELGIKIHSLSASCKIKNELYYWKLNNSQVYEIPIYAVPIKKYKILTIRRLSTLFYVWAHSPPRRNREYSTYHDESSSFIIDYCSKWDFSKLTKKEMVNYLECAIRKYDYKKYDIPLVMIGHTKDFFNDRNFEKFLDITTNKYIKKGIARFTTFREFAERYMKTGE